MEKESWDVFILYVFSLYHIFRVQISKDFPENNSIQHQGFLRRTDLLVLGVASFRNFINSELDNENKS